MSLKKTGPERSLTLAGLIAVQILCAAFFILDVAADGIRLGWPPFTDFEFVIEFIAAIGLVAGVAVEGRYLLRLVRREAHLERQLSLAAGAFQEIVEEMFRGWHLTPSEQDIAMFLLKGLAIPEIAQMRGSAEGTVKSHLNAIYRKAGVTGRGAFLSLFLEELMQPPAEEQPAAAEEA